MLLRCDDSTAKRIVHEHQQTNTRRRTPEQTTRQTARQKTIKPPPGFGELSEPHRRYIRNRGFDPDQIARDYDCGGIGPFGGAWKWRIVYPIKNRDGRIVAYQGRSIADIATAGNPKYKMTDDADCLEHPHGFLYGIDRVPGDAVVIVEGAPVVWKIGPGTIATMGIGWHPPQMAALRHFRRRFLLYDPEPAAQKRAAQLAASLSLFPGTTDIIGGFTTDIDNFSDTWIRRIRRWLGTA